MMVEDTDKKTDAKGGVNKEKSGLEVEAKGSQPKKLEHVGETQDKAYVDQFIRFLMLVLTQLLLAIRNLFLKERKDKKEEEENKEDNKLKIKTKDNTQKNKKTNKANPILKIKTDLDAQAFENMKNVKWVKAKNKLAEEIYKKIEASDEKITSEALKEKCQEAVDGLLDSEKLALFSNNEVYKKGFVNDVRRQVLKNDKNDLIQKPSSRRKLEHGQG